MTSVPHRSARLARLRNALDPLIGPAGARCWIGERPAGDHDDLVRAVMARIGYPTSRTRPFAFDALPRLTRDGAALVLALAMTASLAYDRHRTTPQDRATAASILAILHEDAVFVANGRWRDNDDAGWYPLGDATFDAGVLGYDNELAFIFWIEDED